MKNRAKLIVLLALCLVADGLAKAKPKTDYVVRLKMPVNNKQATVGGIAFSIVDLDSNKILVKNINRPVRLQTTKAGIRIEDREQGLDLIAKSLLFEGLGALELDGRLLVGLLEVRQDDRGNLLAVNRLDLDRYLKGLLGVEMSPSWPLEALKAQAVAARTYALRKLIAHQDELFDMSTTTLDQVYKGISAEGQRTMQAVDATHGQVLTYKGELAETLFHACCGGHTLPARSVFGGNVPYLVAVEDRYCAGCWGEKWNVEVTFRELNKQLRKVFAKKGWQGPIKKAVVQKKSGKNIQLLVVGNLRLKLSKVELRKLLGVKKIKSNNFDIQVRGKKIVFQGNGRGHGVGLCQWGARRMAEKKKSYKEILKKYYPKTKMVQMY
jgi:stage II sporulation protein D